MNLRFEERYFKNAAGEISNYRDYTQRKYEQTCLDLIGLGILPEHRIVDFGCATGALLKEFVKRGYRNICGTDVSHWAVNYGRSTYGLTGEQLQYLNYSLLESGADWLICLDVFEHIGNEELNGILDIIRCDRMVMRVPVCAKEGEPYLLAVSRNDKTHVQCHTKEWWRSLLTRHAQIEASIHGVAIYDSPGVMAAIFKWHPQSASP